MPSKLYLATLLATLACYSLQAQDASESSTNAAPVPEVDVADVDVVAIVRQSVQRDAQNYERLKNYTFEEHWVERRFNGDGEITSSESETSEVMMLAGSPYYRLIARDGALLSDKDAAKQQKKLDEELAKRLKNPEKEKAKFEEDRAEERRFLQEIPDAFQFTLLGVEAVEDRPAWKIHAEPRAEYEPKEGRAKNLKKVRGTIWIDQQDYQWVRADLELVDTISWGLFIVRIAPGGSVHFTQTRINDEVWLPQRVAVRGEARIALFKKIRAEFETTYQEYRRFQTESQIVGVEALAAPE